MPDYKLGKIYQIWSPNTDKVYIGSTTQPLHKRLYDHNHPHNHGSTGKKYVYSRKVLECGDARIELIEDYPCAKKSELNRREGQVMRGYDNRVNKNIAGRTPAEYRVDNKERKQAQGREYRQKPEVKERKQAQGRERYLREKEHVLAQVRERYLREKEQIRAQQQAYSREYRLRPEVKERRAAHSKEWSQRPEVKERRAAQARERRQRPEVREHIAAQRKDWEQKPEVKARRAARRKELRQRKKEQQSGDTA